MKKLGLIGGMGPESTIPYYHGIVHGVRQLACRPFFPNLTIESVDLFHILNLLNERKHEELADLLLAAIENLAKAGCDVAALTANTAHIVFDRLQQRSPLRLISIVDETCRQAVKRGYSKVGLLGTKFTMENDFFKAPFERNGISVAIPDAAEREYINDKIYNELEFGIMSDETRRNIIKTIARLKSDQGVEAVILGCTELPLLLNDAASPLPTLDTMQIHIAALTAAIMQ